MTARPEVIAIDLDNTMYAYEPCHNAAMSVVSREVRNRLQFPTSKWNLAYEEARNGVKARLGEVASSHSRLAYFKGALENLGMQSHLDFALQLEVLYWGEFIRQIKKADDLDNFLEVAREKGIPVIVVTDLTTGIQIKKIHKLGITDMITALVTSEDVGADKPNPGFYEYITSQLGIQGEHWWVVGDDKEKDGGFSARLPSSDFHHVSANGRSITNFTELSNSLKITLQ
jgi:HAD superfamily hydrolase (TIGR01549 family)